MKILRNISKLLTMNGYSDDPLGIVEDAEVWIEDGKIAWVGRRGVPEHPSGQLGPVQNDDGSKDGSVRIPDDCEVDLKGAIVMPALIDCHTHAVFAGDRSNEYHLRSKGATYPEILAAGGGIHNTVKAVRNASVDELVERSLGYLAGMRGLGVSTVEIKSGYGLDVQTELKMLEVIKRLWMDSRLRGKDRNIEIYPTFLGAHVVPDEYRGRKDVYVDLIIHEMLPAVKEQGIAKACDIFAEHGAFELKDAEKILGCAKDLGMEIQMHAEQLSHTGATSLAVELGCSCVGHLEYMDEVDIEKLAGSKTIPVCLPLAQEFLSSPKKTPAKQMIEAGCEVAVATDFNPGSAMCPDLWWAARLAISTCGLSCEDALLGMTKYAAKALGMQDRGIIKAGMNADLIALNETSPWAPLYKWKIPEVWHVEVG